MEIGVYRNVKYELINGTKRIIHLTNKMSRDSYDFECGKASLIEIKDGIFIEYKCSVVNKYLFMNKIIVGDYEIDFN